MATTNPGTQTTADTPSHSETVSIGLTAYDTRRKQLGTVMAVNSRISLRPIGGGVEWDADPSDVRPARASERLSPGVAAANQRTRESGGGSW